LDKDSAKNLDNKVEQFRRKTRTKKQLFVVLMTVNGVTPSLWLEDVVDNILTLNDLFA